MRTFLIITNNINTNVELIPCETIEEAVKEMKIKYDKICSAATYDFYNTFIDEEAGYAQIVNGFKQTEFRIGQAA